MLKTRILGVVVLVILIIMAILGVATFVLMGNAEDLYRQSSREGTHNLLNKVIDNAMDKMEASATAFTRNSEAMMALQEKNPEDAKSASIGTFNRLNSDGVISALRIFDTQGAPFAMHGAAAQSAGDRSALVDSAIKTSKSTRGLERTSQGTPVARHVIPLVQRGDLIGVAVFEKAFGSLLTEVAEASTSATALMTLEHVVIEATDKPLFANLSGVVKRDTTGYVKARHGEAHLSVSSIMLHDNDAKPLGIFVTAKDNTKAYARDTRITLLAIAISLGVFLLCVGFLWHYIRNAFKPLDRMVEVMNRVQCNGDFSERAPIHNLQDEVGIASTSFNELLARIAEIILAIQQSTESIADAAQKMANSGAKLTQGSTAQSTAADEVAATMEETAASISETASNAKSANEVAQQAQHGIERSLAAMHEALTNVENVAKLIRNASDNVGLLDDSSKKIGGIVQVIKEIADQTNLLALNAAIEAARAGEQGRGFAVVADEVRKLAEGTTKATNEIASLIGGIQSQINAAVMEMRDANTESGRGLELVGQTEATLRAVGNESASAAANMRAIADAVQEQDMAVHQVAERIEYIARITEENGSVARSTADTAAHLDELASRLRSSVSGLKTVA